MFTFQRFGAHVEASCCRKTVTNMSKRYRFFW